MKEFFKINHHDVGFANHATEGTVYSPGALDTEVLVRKGKLRISLLTPSLEITDELHNGILQDAYFDNLRKTAWIRLVTYHDLAIEGGTYDTQIVCPYGNHATGFEVYGFPEDVRFHGIIDVQAGYVHLKGELKSINKGNQVHRVPIEIVKAFDPKPLLPKRKVYTWEAAQSADPLSVFELTIGEGNFDHFPEKILSFKNLESLWVGARSNFNFSEIPAAFYTLTELHTIQIYGSEISQLSEDLVQLQKLEELTLQSSALQKLPTAISSLPVLSHLSLKYNKLKELPASIGAMPNLKSLDIEGNRFKTLPASLNNIKSVTASRKHRKLFMDLSYPSKNTQAIDETKYDLSNYPAEKIALEKRLRAIPDLVDFTELILAYSTMATYLVLEATTTDIPLGKSKLGGAPDLPSDWEHPRSEQGNFYLFHAQLNCEALAPYQPYLPRKGMLYFFVNDEEYAQRPLVLYAEHTENLRRIEYTEATKFMDYDYDGAVRDAVAVGFQNAIDFPIFYNSYNHGSERYPKYAALWEEKDDEEMYEKMDALEGYDFEQLAIEMKTPLALDNGHIQIRTHSINSSVFSQHESPQEIAAGKLGGEPSEWMVLLNMESVGEFNFWDAGTLSYCIHKKDLAIQDFSKISASIESS